MYRNTYLEINLDNIKKNTHNLLQKYNDYDYYFGVVKGNAYGHGFYIINTLIEAGINYLAVSNLDEALKIRKINKEIPILCLEPINLKWLEICSKENITITVSSLDYVKKINEFQNSIKIHIKIDSGMNRLGFDNKKDLEEAINLIKENSNLYLEGIYTHMGTLGINDPYRKKQLTSFEDITSNINLAEFKIVHIDRSVTAMCNKKIDYCNGVRMGISLYGYNQLPIINNTLKDKLRNIKRWLQRKKYHIENYEFDRNIDLTPALSLYSEVIEIKTVHNGEFVGYFGYLHQGEDITVATVCIGYADGLDLKSNGAYVSIKNKKYKIIGTINMGMISVVVDKNIMVGDKVAIISNDNGIRELSSCNETTIYKTMTCLSPLLPRVYIKNNKVEKIEEMSL